MTKEQKKTLDSMLSIHNTRGERLKLRRYVARMKYELLDNLKQIAAERKRGAEPHRRPHLRYIKRRSLLGLEVIAKFHKAIKRAA
jgi:hypothetical protein